MDLPLFCPSVLHTNKLYTLRLRQCKLPLSTFRNQTVAAHRYSPHGRVSSLPSRCLPLLKACAPHTTSTLDAAAAELTLFLLPRRLVSSCPSPPPPASLPKTARIPERRIDRQTLSGRLPSLTYTTHHPTPPLTCPSTFSLSLPPFPLPYALFSLSQPYCAPLCALPLKLLPLSRARMTRLFALRLTLLHPALPPSGAHKR